MNSNVNNNYTDIYLDSLRIAMLPLSLVKKGDERVLETKLLLIELEADCMVKAQEVKLKEASSYWETAKRCREAIDEVKMYERIFVDRNELLEALKEIASIQYRGNRHDSSWIAERAIVSHNKRNPNNV